MPFRMIVPVAVFVFAIAVTAISLKIMQAPSSFPTWDFTASHSIQQVPVKLLSDGRRANLFNVKAPIRIVCGKKASKFNVETVSFQENGGKLDYVVVVLANETFDEICGHAEALATTWELNKNKFLVWKGASRKKNASTCILFNHSSWPVVDAEIIPTFNAVKPWSIKFSLGWP